MQFKNLSWRLVKTSALFCFLLPSPTAAQIAPDQTLPTNSQITQQGSVTFIEGGTRTGNNLFHSFDSLSIPSGGIVQFNNALDIQNIFGRITGKSISNIDGLIRANGIANLFLINPNGIRIGPNARLNIGGSFIASTASSIKFADGISFDAKPSGAESLLTVNVPVGLGFGTNAGSIRVDGDGQGIRKTSDLIDTTSGLRVQPNQTLALVGGDVALSGGTLKTTGGQIELGSVAAPGLVNLTPTDMGWTFGYSGIPTLGDIQLSGAAAVDASGNSGGNIQIQARKLTLLSGSQIEASTLGAGTGGTLRINASSSVNLVGSPELDSFFNTGISNLVYPGATGDGGNIKIETGQLNVRDGAGIAAGTYGIGNAGSIEVLAHDSVSVLRKPTANAGSSITSLAQRGSTGSGGNIKIETVRLSLHSGGVISSGTFGQGSGGNVSITASEGVQIIGKSLTGNSPSRISSRTGGTGKAGNLTIETGRLTVTDGGRVNIGGEKIKKNLNIQPGQGNAGTLRINANSVNLDRGTITAGTASGTEGEGGDIFLRSDDLRLRNSSITASAGGDGNGGNITINTDTLAALEKSSITANAFEGRGGNIQITASGVFLSPDSKITASSERGIDGTVKINTIDPNLESATKIPTEFQIPKVALICAGRKGGAADASLINIGKGGIPPSPEDPLTGSDGWHDNSAPTQGTEESENSPKPIGSTDSEIEIVEAQGWKDNGDGTVSFTVEPDSIFLNNSLLKSGCAN